MSGEELEVKVAGKATQGESVGEATSMMELLKRINVDVKPGVTLLVYGEPMVGKTWFSWRLAGEFARAHGKQVAVVATEPVYENRDFIDVMARATGTKPMIVIEKIATKIPFLIQRLKDYVIVVDSLGSIADWITQMLYAQSPQKPVEARVVASRASPLLRQIAYTVKNIVLANGTIGILVSHSIPTAGAGLYRGAFETKPAISTRVGHYLEYIVELRFGGDRFDRVLTCVANRLNPWAEGMSVTFTIPRQ